MSVGQQSSTNRPIVGYLYGFGKMPVSDPEVISPSNLLRGAVELERLGYVIKYFFPALYAKGWIARSRFFAYVWFLVRARRALATCDVLYVYTQKMIFAAALARSVGILRSQVILLLGSIEVGMPRGSWNRKWFRLIDRWALRSAAITLYYTAAEAELARRNTGLGADKICWMRFAVDSEFYTPSVCGKSDYVIAIGNDHRRDWRITAEIARRLPRVSFKVASQDVKIRSISFPPNVELCFNLSVAGSKSLVEGARCLLLATKTHLGFSGTTTIMNAMLLGTPVILDEAHSLPDYKLRHEINCMVFQRGDAEEATRYIQRILDDRTLEQRLRSEGLAMRDTFSMNTYAKTLAGYIDQFYQQRFREGATQEPLARSAGVEP